MVVVGCGCVTGLWESGAGEESPFYLKALSDRDPENPEATADRLRLPMVRWDHRGLSLGNPF